MKFHISIDMTQHLHINPLTLDCSKTADSRFYERREYLGLFHPRFVNKNIFLHHINLKVFTVFLHNYG